MRLETDQFWTFSEWLLTHGGLLNGFLLAIVLMVLGFILSYVVSIVRYGPGEGFYVVSKNIRDLFTVDLPNTSIRRIFAIAKLAFMEAVRRKVLVVVAIFIVGLMFAGWFLDEDSENPATLYISFVLTSTNYLVLLLGLYLSTFSLPTDIKNKTIYTITTKPVRATEIILGRIGGFAFIGTCILLVLGTLGYIFVVRGLSHTHDVEAIAAGATQGQTTLESRHRHAFTVDAEGFGETDTQKGHYHEISPSEASETGYEIGAPIGWLSARVPVYGALSFTDRDGKVGGKEYGLNVGRISEYQRYIAGSTLMSAIWTFDNVTADRFDNEQLRIEMQLAVFRTYKNDIVTPVRGILILRSTDGVFESERRYFDVKEYALDRHLIDRKMQGFENGVAREIDLFDDLAGADGKVQVILRCDDSGQYLGMAQADLWLRAGDRSFLLNFIKGYVSIWLQMVIIISFGVMFSAFLSGPVAMVATMAALFLGFFGSSTSMYFEKQEYSGGGPIEAMIRLVTQKGSMHELDTGNATLEKAIRGIDFGLMYSVELLKGAVPNFSQLGTADFVAYGVDLFSDLLLRQIVMTLGYVIVATTIGYFFLKTREIAA